MKIPFKMIAKTLRNIQSAFGETSDQVVVDFVPSNRDGLEPEMLDLIGRIRAFNRRPLYEPTALERKEEADVMRDLKAWIRKLSGNDRSIISQRQPWEIMNHIMGIVPIDGVVAVGRGASYDFATTTGFKNDFADFKPQTVRENTLCAASPQPLSRWTGPKQASNEAKPEPSYTHDYKPPQPSASFMAKFA